MPGRWVAVASAMGLIAVGTGALGAHAFEGHLEPNDLAAFEVAVRYQMYHALALLAVAWVASAQPSKAASAAGSCMLLGVVCFSGSLYGLIFLKWRWLGPITPVGGVLLMAGWFLLAVAALRPPHKPVQPEP